MACAFACSRHFCQDHMILPLGMVDSLLIFRTRVVVRIVARIYLFLRRFPFSGFGFLINGGSGGGSGMSSTITSTFGLLPTFSSSPGNAPDQLRKEFWLPYAAARRSRVPQRRDISLHAERVWSPLRSCVG